MKQPSRVVLLVAALWLVFAPLPAEARIKIKLPRATLSKATGWVASIFAGHAASQAIDHVTGQDCKTQLEAEIPRLLDQIRTASGDERRVLSGYLEAVEREIRIVDRALVLLADADAALGAETSALAEATATLDRELAALEAEQREVVADLADLDRRTTELEGRVDRLDDEVARLDARLADVEEALIGECLDRRYAPRLGAEGFRIQEGDRDLLEHGHDAESLTVETRVYLDVCTADLRQRGLLLQFAWITRDLAADLDLYATFKHIEPGGFDRVRMNQLARLRFPLGRPLHRVDGHVAEIFIPYDEIPIPRTDRLALALVMTYDGGPIYSLPDRPLTCHFGQRVDCRWGS